MLIIIGDRSLRKSVLFRDLRMKACGLRVTIPRIKGSSDFAVKGEIYSLARIENIEEKGNMKIGEYSMEIYIFSIYLA